MAGASAQARIEMPASAPRGCWDLAEAPGVLAGADTGVLGHSSRASLLERPELAPGQPGGSSSARLGVQRWGCRIPAGRARWEGLSAVFGRFQDTCEHPGPSWGGRPWESARPLAGPPWREQLRSLNLAVFIGSLTALSCHLSGLLLRDRCRSDPPRRRFKHTWELSPAVSTTMAANLLEDWCRGMEVDIHRSLLVTGIPEDCGQAEIEETLNGVLSPLGPYSVLNKIFLREENAKAALVEVGEGVNLRAIPREFPGRGGIWRVVCRDPTQDAEFLKNLNEFLYWEERTLEDVVRLLELSRASPPQTQNRSPENWAEALGVLLGAVVQIIYYMDAETRSQEEARAQELAKPQVVASLASAAGGKVKKKPGRAAERGRGSALKMESPDGWNDVAGGGDGPKTLVRKAGALIHSRRKKQKETPKQEPVPWKKSQGSHSHSLASLKHPAADGGKNREMLERVRSNKEPCVKQEGSALKKPRVKCAWKFPSNPPCVAASWGVASESDQDGVLEGPPKKNAMGWASAKSPAHMRKKKKVSLGPVSYVPVDSEDLRKKPEVSKKGRDAPDQKAPGDPQPHESPTSASQGPEAKPQGPPHASSGEHDIRSHLGCVNKWMEGEEQQGKAGAQEPKGAEGQMVGEDPSAVEEAGEPPTEASEAESPDPPS